MIGKNETTERENAILAKGKNLFFECLDRFNVPVEEQVKLWDLAFSAGEIVQNSKSAADIKRFSKSLDGVFNV